MTIGADNSGNGSTTAQDRFSGGVTAYRQTRREAALAADGEDELGPRSSGGSALPTRTRMGLPGLTEPVFPVSGGWADPGPAPSMADHPLLRGLLLELPVRGSTPDPGWLDRWFEAARSILELLYVQEARK